MKLVIREEAADDLDAIYDWIAKDSESSAARIVRALRQRMNSVLMPAACEHRAAREKGRDA